MFKIAAVAFAFAALATPASASLAFLSRTGSGTSCTLANPCKDMTAAIAAAGAGGNVVCLDRSDYSGSDFVDINTSIKISCGDGLWQGYGTALRINPPANSSVLIEGFVSDGDSTVNSIEYTGKGTLALHRVRVSSSGGGRNGVNFSPSGPATLHVSDSVFYKTAGSGILIKPTSGASANVTVSRTYLTGNVNGIFVDGSGGGNGINLNVRDCVVSGSSNSGIPIVAPSVPVTVLIDRTTVNYSLNTGVAAGGAGAFVRIGNSTISNNVTGVLAFSGATMLSFKNNQIKANTTNNTPIAADNLD